MSSTLNIQSFGNQSPYDSALAQAMAQLAASGGGTLYFPAGDYYFDQTIQLQPNTTLLGEGRHSRLILNQNSTSIFISAKYANYSGLKCLYLEGNSTTASNNDAYGFYAQSSERITVENCGVSNFGRGLIIQHSCKHCRIINCVATNCQYCGIGSYAYKDVENKYIDTWAFG